MTAGQSREPRQRRAKRGPKARPLRPGGTRDHDAESWQGNLAQPPTGRRRYPGTRETGLYRRGKEADG